MGKGKSPKKHNRKSIFHIGFSVEPMPLYMRDCPPGLFFLLLAGSFSSMGKDSSEED